jgi:hypothetical protein
VIDDDAVTEQLPHVPANGTRGRRLGPVVAVVVAAAVLGAGWLLVPTSDSRDTAAGTVAPRTMQPGAGVTTTPAADADPAEAGSTAPERVSNTARTPTPRQTTRPNSPDPANVAPDPIAPPAQPAPRDQVTRTPDPPPAEPPPRTAAPPAPAQPPDLSVKRTYTWTSDCAADGRPIVGGVPVDPDNPGPAMTSKFPEGTVFVFGGCENTAT